MKVLIGLLLVGLAIEGRAQLTCFMCDNCPDPFEPNNFPQQTCPLPTTPPVTPPGEATTPQPPTPTGPDTPIITPPQIGTPTAPAPEPEATTPVGGPIITPPSVGRKKRQVAQTSHRCFFMIHNGVTRRGCTPHGNDHMETCRTLNNNVQPTGECRVCDWAGCNSASGLTLSIATLLAALMIALRFY